MTITDYNQAVDEWADALYRYALKNLGNTVPAQDIVQDCYEKLWIHRDNIDPVKVKSWLFTTAHHTMIDGIRKQQKETLLATAKLPESAFEQGYSDLQEILNLAVEKLPEIQKSVLLLRDYEGYSYREIGEITDLSEAQVKVYILPFKGIPEKLYWCNRCGNMKITRDNYEIWFLDYLEGRLDRKGTEEVQLFMVQHPDLADELESLSPALQTNQFITFQGKEFLKKELFEDNEFLENTAIAALESDLTHEELSSFEKWVSKNPESRKLIKNLENTRLKPNLSISYPGKERLKEKTTVITGWYKISAAAATLLLALLLLIPGKKREEQKFASTVEQKTTPKVEASGLKTVIEKPAVSKPIEEKILPKATLLASGQKITKTKLPPSSEDLERQIVRIDKMQARAAVVNSDALFYTDLMPVRNFVQLTNRTEIPISDYLEDKLQTLKANGPKGFFTREEVKVAGLRLFSRLPGRHLTGKKGNDGRLRTISFNTSLLAFSIPINR